MGVFGVLIYWMSGLQADGGKFLLFMLTLWSVSVLSQSLGFAGSALAPTVEVANAVAPLFIIIFFLFSGFYLNAESIPVWFIWLEVFSYIKYAYEIVVVNEFTDLQFKCFDDM